MAKCICSESRARVYARVECHAVFAGACVFRSGVNPYARCSLWIRAFLIFPQNKTTPNFTIATRSHLERASGIVIVEAMVTPRVNLAQLSSIAGCFVGVRIRQIVTSYLNTLFAKIFAPREELFSDCPEATRHSCSLPERSSFARDHTGVWHRTLAVRQTTSMAHNF